MMEEDLPGGQRGDEASRAYEDRAHYSAVFGYEKVHVQIVEAPPNGLRLTIVDRLTQQVDAAVLGMSQYQRGTNVVACERAAAIGAMLEQCRTMVNPGEYLLWLEKRKIKRKTGSNWTRLARAKASDPQQWAMIAHEGVAGALRLLKTSSRKQVEEKKPPGCLPPEPVVFDLANMPMEAVAWTERSTQLKDEFPRTSQLLAAAARTMRDEMEEKQATRAKQRPSKRPFEPAVNIKCHVSTNTSDRVRRLEQQPEADLAWARNRNLALVGAA